MFVAAGVWRAVTAQPRQIFTPRASVKMYRAAKVVLRPLLCLTACALGLALNASACGEPAYRERPSRSTAWHDATAETHPTVWGVSRFEGTPSAIEAALSADADQGQWDRISLMAAALAAGGVTDPDRNRQYETLFELRVAELQKSGCMNRPPRQRAEEIFEFLHRRILRGGYRVDCSDLSDTLVRGHFNCLTASILFNCLARRCGLTVQTIQLPGHARSRLILPEGPLDIETTCPEWFSARAGAGKTRAGPRDDAENGQFSGLAGVHVPVFSAPPAVSEEQADLSENTIGMRSAGPDNPARVLSDVQLVATVYYNRGIELLRQERFAEAAAANARALRLDPASVTARGNLLATLNNWAIQLGSERKFSAAAQLLQDGLALDPGYEKFHTNYVVLHRRWIESLVDSGRLQEARRVARQVVADPILADRAAEFVPPALMGE
jgi:hypothetical protein